MKLVLLAFICVPAFAAKMGPRDAYNLLHQAASVVRLNAAEHAQMAEALKVVKAIVEKEATSLDTAAKEKELKAYLEAKKGAE